MKKRSTRTDELAIPEVPRAALGAGVRGKYLDRYAQGTNVVVVRPELHKVFPTSEAVNDALASYLAFAKEAKTVLGRSAVRRGKRRAA